MKFILPVFLLLLIALSEQERRRTTTATPEKSTDPPKQAPLQWIRATRLYRYLVRLFEIVAALVTVVATVNAFLGGLPWPFKPDVQTPPPSLSFPFLIPFQISNKSGLFPFNNLGITCVIDQLGAYPNTYIQQSSISVSAMGLSNIQPTRSDWYLCPFRPFVSPSQQVQFAEMHFVLSYDTYWPLNHRVVRSIHFTWYGGSVPGRWLEGSRLN